MPDFEDVSLDIVIPAYNEGAHLFHNIAAIDAVLAAEKINRRFILVNDGSGDNTWTEIKRLKETFSHVSGVNLSRNFGKEAALCAGLSEVTAPLCVVMDSDLQHPPALIPEMLKKQREGYQIVEGVKEDRGKESFFSKLAAAFFYRLIDRLSGFEMKNASDFKLIDRQAIAAWQEIGDTHAFFRGMIAWVGFEKATVYFRVPERSGGQTKFSKVQLIKLALRAITSYSAAPLFLTNLLSSAFFIGALALGGQTLYNKFAGVAESGFSTVILLLLILGSAILFCLGIIGTYISRIYDEVKNRPRYIVKEKL
ncbi:MAG: glycosyltransferase family 2 protein [Clostridiales bacterium]|jgi:dolichol-phosphate mannosyltransferase|nr:glycosyltransferase family 2 protein [Clostridiales bacterium]